MVSTMPNATWKPWPRVPIPRAKLLRYDNQHKGGGPQANVTDTAADPHLAHLTRAEAHLGAILGRPKLIAISCIIALSGLGWGFLALCAAARGPESLLGVLDAMCRAATIGAAGEAAGAGGLLLVWLMWSAMALAMMLPTAGPMILTYAEIADTAARKGELVVSPFVLAGGYIAVWLGFALIATSLQVLLTQAVRLAPWPGPAGALVSAGLFVGAGLYQFSPLKQACLAACQRPFPFFFANWTNRASGVFRLGLRQGMHCLGCCWALMLVMLAVGTMNVAWMAGLGAIMAAEKMTSTPRVSRLVGTVFVAVGLWIFFAFMHRYGPGLLN